MHLHEIHGWREAVKRAIADHRDFGIRFHSANFLLSRLCLKRGPDVHTTGVLVFVGDEWNTDRR